MGLKNILLLCLGLLFAAPAFSQSSTIIEITRPSGEKIGINADEIRRVIQNGSGAIIYSGWGSTTVTYITTTTYVEVVNESCQTFVITNVLLNGISTEMAFNIKHVETVNPLVSGKASIIMKQSREQYNTTANYTSVIALFGNCVGTAGLTVVTHDATLDGLGTAGTPLKVAQQGASTGNVLKWTGITWAPGVDNTGVLTQPRLSGDGSAIPLDIAQNGATSGQVLKWNGSAWAPANDAGGSGTYSGGTGIDVTGTVISNTGDLSATNEIQTLSVVGTDLTLSLGGGTVSLPAGISPYDAGNGAIVVATGLGVTFAKASGTGTFTAPSGVHILSARINGTAVDLDGTNSFSVVWPSTLADDFPSVTKINRISGASPTPVAPYTYDIDNSPLLQVVASTGSGVTIKVINFNAFSNWALKIVK